MPKGESVTEEIPFTCTLDCGSRCELVAHVQDGRLVRIDTPPDRPDTTEMPRLIPCARGRAGRRLLDAPSRVLRPLRRTGLRGSGEFEEITWDDALDIVASRLSQVRDSPGPQGLLHATGPGASGSIGISGSSASRRFFSYWGGVTATSGNMSSHSATLAAQWMFGRSVPASDRATLLDSQLIVLWACNPAENLMGPNTAHFIARARDQGAKVVLIDPRLTDSGVLADQWIPIRPGTDAALAAAMAYVMEAEDLLDREFLASHTAGYEAYRQYLLGGEDSIPKTPEWAADITGAPAAKIRGLAREYGTTKPAALLAGWGHQRSLNGEQSARALITLACMSGNVGVRGGGLASVGMRWGSPVSLKPLPMGPHGPARTVSASAWAEDLLSGTLAPPLKLAYVVATNLINRSSNTRENARALEHLDFVVVHEQFLTPTARHADVVLPICTHLERPEVVGSWGHDSHLFHSSPVVDPAGESRTDYWAFSQLAERLGFGEAYTAGKTEHDWVDFALAGSGADTGALRREGVLRTDGPPRVALADFRADPVARPLPTRSGRIEIACSPAEESGLPAIPSYVPAGPNYGEEYPLQLVTPHSKLRSNSCLHANPWLPRLEPHAVWISARDAKARGVEHGDPAEVFNSFGTVSLPARVTERIMPGVVCIYQGTWYRPGKDGVDDGGCANVLTSHQLSPTGGMTTHSGWVEVRKGQA